MLYTLRQSGMSRYLSVSHLNMHAVKVSLGLVIPSSTICKLLNPGKKILKRVIVAGQKQFRHQYTHILTPTTHRSHRTPCGVFAHTCQSAFKMLTDVWPGPPYMLTSRAVDYKSSTRGYIGPTRSGALAQDFALCLNYKAKWTAHIAGHRVQSNTAPALNRSLRQATIPQAHNICPVR